MRFTFSLGPAALVTAAFIGPGTLTLCVMAGVTHGFSLLWVMMASIGITIYIQNTAARIAWTTRKGLAKSSLELVSHPLAKLSLAGLLITSIVGGNAAYEAGNLSGAILGVQGMVGDTTFLFQGFDTLPLLFGAIVSILLWKGSFAFLKKSLTAVVILMSLSFLITAIMTQPAISLVFKGLFTPSIREGELLTIVGLLGTTVVPYNLFLHAAMVAQSPNIPFSQLKRDTFWAVGLGGVISLCIIISAASIEGATLSNAADLGQALAPLYGTVAPFLMSVGFFAAGLTSALTAPIAAAYVIAECFNIPVESKAFKFSALLVLGVGILFNSWGMVPLSVIRFAQIANGILLPVIGGLLLFMVNNNRLMQGRTPNRWQNIIFCLIELFFIFLGVKSLGILF